MDQALREKQMRTAFGYFIWCGSVGAGCRRDWGAADLGVLALVVVLVEHHQIVPMIRARRQSVVLLK